MWVRVACLMRWRWSDMSYFRESRAHMSFVNFLVDSIFFGYKGASNTNTMRCVCPCDCFSLFLLSARVALIVMTASFVSFCFCM